MGNLSELTGLLGDYAPWLIVVPFLGRAYHAIVNGGGVIGAWRAFMYGTNVPKNKQ